MVTSPNGNAASLEVEDPAGNDVLETEPNDGQNAATAQVVAGTTYSVRLRSTNDSAAAYVATLSLATGTGGNPGGGGDAGGEPGTAPADLVAEAEPNDSRSEATAFAFGSDGEVQLAGVSQSDDDKDFFRFTASETGLLRINVLAPNDNFAALQIEDAAGTKLFETEPNDGVQSGAFHVVAGTSYSLRMRSKTDAAAEYLVELKMTRDGDLTADTVIDRSDVVEAMLGWLHHGNSGHGADDNYDGRVSLDEILRIRNLQDASGAEPGNVLTETESNGSQSSANRFRLGSDGAIQLQGTSRNDRDKDYFTFVPEVSGTLTVNVASPNGNFAALEIEDAASVDVFETEPNDDVNSGTSQVVAGTQYFVRLRGKTATAADYEVNLSLSAGSGNGGGEDPGGGNPGDPPAEPANLVIETEPNSEREEANPFALGSDNLVQLQGVSADSKGDEEDYFKFTAGHTGTLTANVLSRSGLHAQLEIEDSDGNVVLHTEPSNGVNAASGAVTEGTSYFVRLRGSAAYYDVGNGSEYLVNLSLTPGGTSEVVTLAVDDAATVGEDQGVIVVDVLANDTSANGAKKVIAVDRTGLRGTANANQIGSSVVYAVGSGLQSLKAGESATEVFSYTMQDGAGVQSTAQVTVTVAGANDAPAARADSVTVAKNSGPVTIDVLSNDTDIDAGDTKAVVAVDGSETPGWIELILIYGVGVGQWHPGTPAIQGTVSVSADGQSVVYDPGEAFASLAVGETATESFRYTMTDSAGAESTGTVAVTITGAVNPAPAAALVASTASSPTHAVAGQRRVVVAQPKGESTVRMGRRLPSDQPMASTATRSATRRLSAASVDAVLSRAVVE